MPYHVDIDPYKDETTGILRNKLGITTQGALSAAEAEITSIEITTLMIEDKLSFDKFNASLLSTIHKRLFGKLRII